jgi:DMSO/TMAO reductase YedYZ molybdopterin-dependent catalytic subunit
MPGGGRLAAALVGVCAAAVALGTAQFVAGITAPESSPVIAVGETLIDAAPTPVKDFAVRTLGTGDKPVLVGAILILLALASMSAGILAVRHPAAGDVVVALFGLTGALCAVTRPVAAWPDVLPSVSGAAAGVVAMRLLAHAAPQPRPQARRAGDRGQPPALSSSPARDQGPESSDRRRFLAASGAVASLALATGGGGVLLAARRSAAARPATVRLPRPASPARPLPAGFQVAGPGMTPFFTPTRDFYRVDTALLVPKVHPLDWRLRVHGMVDRELRLSLADLLRRDLAERDITLSCVSNEVGGLYVGTARWLGAPLAGLLHEAGVHADADQLLSRSVDGMSIGTPIETVLDGRDALVAVAMNGEPLPLEHGFPARLLVPGLYGYASATKWVIDLEVTTFARADAYWPKRGWGKDGRVKTASRIDIPRPFSRPRPGPVTIAGVAYAQHRGVAGVEVRIDAGPWREATLATQVSADTWRQWSYLWNAEPGLHRIEVRATDGAGNLQPQTRAQPFPDGATGWHSAVVSVA